MQPAGKDALSRPRFALDEDGREVPLKPSFGGENHLQPRPDPGEAFPEEQLGSDPWELLGHAELIAPGHPALFAAPHECDRQLVRLKGFCEIVAGALSHGLHGLPCPAKGGHDHDAGIFREGPVAKQLQGIAVRQVEVDQGEVEPEVGESPARLSYGGNLDNLRAEAAKMGDEPPSQNQIILQQENFAPCGWLGVDAHGPRNASHAYAGININRNGLPLNPGCGLVACVQSKPPAISGGGCL